ncbi:hypothetical protein [Alistipes sp.]|uniref:NigD1/NigD2 family lipoprotein n=1 Tax=Alistipes sp. TaxID=1872444 RepID=UPI003A8420F4
MKKFSLFLLGALAVLGLAACNDDDGDYPKSTPLITTVCPLDGGDYYFQRDNGEKLYPSDKTRVPGYKPDGDQKQRAIIWFSLLDQTIPGYRYNIALYAVEEIYTGTSEVVDDAARLEELGDAKTGYQLTTFNLSREWLTFCALYSCSLNSKHTFTLAVDKTGTTEFQQSEEGYLDVVVLHNDGDDTRGPDCGFYISFDLTPLAAELEGKKGINLLIPTRENGNRELKLNLPEEK